MRFNEFNHEQTYQDTKQMACEEIVKHYPFFESACVVDTDSGMHSKLDSFLRQEFYLEKYCHLGGVLLTQWIKNVLCGGKYGI